MREFGFTTIVLLLAFLPVTAERDSPMPWDDPAGVATQEQAGAPVALPPTVELGMLSYNVFFRPPPVGWGDQSSCRAERISGALAERASGLDFVVLIESFDRAPTGYLAEQLAEQFPHQTLHQPGASGFRINGGLSLLSRHPIVEQTAQAFDVCSGNLGDCMAAKGFLYALVQLANGLKVNLVAAHLDAGDTAKDRQARRAQLSQIRGFLDGRTAFDRWPTVLLGDLNVNGIHPDGVSRRTGDLTEYAEAMGALGNTCASCRTEACRETCEAAPVDTFRTAHGGWRLDPDETAPINTHNCVHQKLRPCDSPNDPEQARWRKRLDYVLHFGSPALAPQMAVDVVDAAHPDFADEACGTRYLSDHKAVEARLRVRTGVGDGAGRLGAGGEAPSGALAR